MEKKELSTHELKLAAQVEAAESYFAQTSPPAEFADNLARMETFLAQATVTTNNTPITANICITTKPLVTQKKKEKFECSCCTAFSALCTRVFDRKDQIYYDY